MSVYFKKVVQGTDLDPSSKYKIKETRVQTEHDFSLEDYKYRTILQWTSVRTPSCTVGREDHRERCP